MLDLFSPTAILETCEKYPNLSALWAVHEDIAMLAGKRRVKWSFRSRGIVPLLVL